MSGGIAFQKLNGAGTQMQNLIDAVNAGNKSDLYRTAKEFNPNKTLTRFCKSWNIPRNENPNNTLDLDGLFFGKWFINHSSWDVGDGDNSRKRSLFQLKNGVEIQKESVVSVHGDDVLAWSTENLEHYGYATSCLLTKVDEDDEQPIHSVSIAFIGYKITVGDDTEQPISDVTRQIQTPSTLGGLIAHYDFGDLNSIILNGDLINSIADKSGNGHLLTSSAGNEPKLLNFGSNGHSFAQFTLGKQLSKQFAVQGPYVMYMFFKNDSYVEGNQLLDFRVNGGGGFPAYVAGVFQKNGETGYQGFGGTDANIQGVTWFENGKWGLLTFFCIGRYASAYSDKSFNPNTKLVEPVTYPFPDDDFQSDFWLHFGKTASFSVHEFVIATFADFDSPNGVDIDRNIRNYFIDKYKPTTRRTMCVAYGDSITAGSYGTDNLGFVHKLCAAKNWGLKNQAQSGSGILNTHNNGTDLLDGLYLKDKFDRDDVLLLNHGANLTTQDFNENIEGYRTVINHFLSMGYKKSRIYLISSFYQAGSEPLVPFVTLLATFADEMGLPFIDLFNAVKNGQLGTVASLSNDGLHPNEVGHQAIADYLIPLINV